MIFPAILAPGRNYYNTVVLYEYVQYIAPPMYFQKRKKAHVVL